MKREKRFKWEPIAGIAPTVRLINLKYKPNLLVLDVQDERDRSAPMLTINFPNFLGFRIIDEGDLLKRTAYDIDESLSKIKIQKDYYYPWSLLIVENSEYLDFFCDKNASTNKKYGIEQYSIFTPNEVVEILTPEDYKPTLAWI